MTDSPSKEAVNKSIELSKVANDAGRTINNVLLKSGHDISMDDCVRIMAIIQDAINKSRDSEQVFERAFLVFRDLTVKQGEMLDIYENFYKAWVVCESSRGCYSCTEPHDCRCPKNQYPEKECKCGRDKIGEWDNRIHELREQLIPYHNDAQRQRENKEAPQSVATKEEKKIVIRPTRSGESFNENDKFIAYYEGQAAGAMAETERAAVASLIDSEAAKIKHYGI